MKLRFTTKSFILSSFLFLVFRFFQILLLTENDTRFLKPQFIWLDVLLMVICLVPLAYTIANTFYAFRCPKAVGKTGICGIIVGVCSGILMMIPAFQNITSDKVSILSILMPLISAAGCFILAASEMFEIKIPKPTFLLLLGSTLYQFISAYTVYTGRPLRVRTVYEILALVTSTLFYLYISKAHAQVKIINSFRLLYPLGFLASLFCFLATVPEAIAFLYGATSKVTAPCVSTFTLFGSGIFITYLTLASNTNKNTNK